MKSVISLLLFFISCSVWGQGGPPLVTDDPGTPGDGHWEINSALQWTPSRLNDTFQFPLLDINYGYGDHLQLNLNKGFTSTIQYGGAVTNGLSLTSLAVKWRFVDEGASGVAISTYPRVDYHDRVSIDDANINSPGSRVFLPFEFSKTLGSFGINPEIGYATYSTFSEWVYGIAGSYSFSFANEVLFELHGRSAVGSTDTELLYNFGTRLGLAKNVSFIGALGQALFVYSSDSLFDTLYLGLQFRI